MKKFLSLVLALVMAMSLVTVSAGAKDFNDGDKISGIAYEEAVNVMSEMGIIDGYGDGNFQPQGTLTRGAAAKIIACMMLGKTTAEALGTQAAPFKDVPVGSTFAGYIAYCSESGIIDGYSDGTFRPGNSLTGFAFLKMLLTALGYDSDIEGYANNPNWTVNVAGRAKQVGLLDGNEAFVGTRAATREEACLYAVNALQATLVEYNDKGGSISVGDITINTGASNATYVTSNVYDAATSINDSTDNVQNGWTVEFAEKYQPELALKDTIDAFGRPAHTWTWKKAEIGTYVEYDKMVAEYTTKVTGRDLYDLLGATTIDDNDVLVYVDGETERDVLDTAYFTANQMVRNYTDKVGETGNGVLTQVFLDTAEDEIIIAVINTYLAKADEDYNTKTEDLDLTVYNISNVGTRSNPIYLKDADDEPMTVEVEDFDIEEVADGDLFLVTVADGAIQTMEAPEIISEASLTNFKRTSYVTANGTQYDYADTARYDRDVLDQYDDSNMKDVTYNLILDPYGYMIGIELNEDPDQYLFLTGIDLGSSNLAARNADANVIFMDGKMDTVTVDMRDSLMAADVDDDGEPDSLSDLTVTIQGTENQTRAQLNTWCTYTVDANGVYTLEQVGAVLGDAAQSTMDANEVGDITIDQKNVSLEGAGAPARVYGNDETVYLVVDPTTDLESIEDINDHDVMIIDDITSVIVGVKNAKILVEDVADDGTYAAPADEVYALYNDDGYVIAAVVLGEDQGISTNYAYIISDDVNREALSGSEWAWTREAVVNGQIVELQEVGTSLRELGNDVNNGNMQQGRWYEIRYNAEGNVRRADPIGFVTAGDEFAESVFELNQPVGGTTKNLMETYDTVVLADDGTTADHTITELTFKNGTLYIDTDATEGFSVSANVKVVLALGGKVDSDGMWDAFDDVTDGYTGYDGLKQAIRDMNVEGAFIAGTVEIHAIIEDGAATTIIINDTNPSGRYNNAAAINVAVANVSVTEGSDATFEAVVTPVVDGEKLGTLTYQWQVWDGDDWQNIAGATEKTYTVKNVTVAADNGDRYRCVVTNTDTSDEITGSITSTDSDDATLTVVDKEMTIRVYYRLADDTIIFSEILTGQKDPGNGYVTVTADMTKGDLPDYTLVGTNVDYVAFVPDGNANVYFTVKARTTISDSVDSDNWADGFTANGDWSVSPNNSNVVIADFSAKSLSDIDDGTMVMNDTAQFLGSLYRNGGAKSIKFDGVTYKWGPKEDGTYLSGSNWFDADDDFMVTSGTKNTLVSALVTWYEGNRTATSVTLTVDGVPLTIQYTLPTT